jgi:uncharacterized protein (TIGR03435 family)
VTQLTDDEARVVREPMLLRIQALLADRFQLQLHRETKELPLYALVVDKNGPKLQEPANGRKEMDFETGRGQLKARNIPMPYLTRYLSRGLGRVVVDKTGLGGKYDFALTWDPEEIRVSAPPVDVPPPSDSNAPSIFTALEEQLGLKLESRRGPVDVLVIEHVERPSEN